MARGPRIPEGCQKVAGGRSPGRRPPEPIAKRPRITQGCQRITAGEAWSEVKSELRPPKRTSSGTPAGVRHNFGPLTGGRSAQALNDHRLPSSNPPGCGLVNDNYSSVGKNNPDRPRDKEHFYTVPTLCVGDHPGGMLEGSRRSEPRAKT